MTQWIKEPLLHFLLLGALIFEADNRLNGSSGIDDDEIVVSLAQQENLANTLARTWQRPPTNIELDALIIGFIRQEIAYRESQSVQLDRDDIVIRRRLRQKLEMLAEDVASLKPPRESDLRQYFEDNAESFRRPAVLSFRQVYFNAHDDPEISVAEVENWLVHLKRQEAAVDRPNVGDPSM